MCRKLLNPTAKLFQGPPYWNIRVTWWNALGLQYHMNTSDWMYQLLFVVNLVKLHLTAQFNSIQPMVSVLSFIFSFISINTCTFRHFDVRPSFYLKIQKQTKWKYLIYSFRNHQNSDNRCKIIQKGEITTLPRWWPIAIRCNPDSESRTECWVSLTCRIYNRGKI